MSGRLILLGGTERAAPYPHWPVFGSDERQALLDVLESGHWAYEGPVETDFERSFAEFQRVGHACAVTNGTTALRLAYEALDLGFGDEVIVPGLTWQATAGAVVDVNAVPVLVDVTPETWCLDPAAAEAAITPRTRAIVAVHLYSNLADMAALGALARRHGLYLIEDCAHAHGAVWRGRGAGALGDIGCFSFQSTKSLTAGEGGCVTTHDVLLDARVRSLRNCGRPPAEPVPGWRPVQGGNERMTEWQAAILRVQLDRFAAQHELRERNRVALDALCAQTPGLVPLRRDPEISSAPGYSYAFRYDAAAFDGLPVWAFRAALAGELGCPDSLAPYQPLTSEPLYQPRTKRRHQLGDEYWQALDPGRFALPTCDTISYRAGVVLSHPALLHEDAAAVLATAVDKIRGNLGALHAWAKDAMRPQPFREASRNQR